MLEPGDVVTVDFAGATGVKRRPTIVLSGRTYHAHRPDVILGALTSRVASATAPTDYVLRDWEDAGLRKPTAFRAYLNMARATAVEKIGHLSDRDWVEVQARISLAFDVPPARQAG